MDEDKTGEETGRQSVKLRSATLFPTDLWNLRNKHNLTCAQLAEIVGVHKSQVTRWETGKQKIPFWLSNLLRYWEASKDR